MTAASSNTKNQDIALKLIIGNSSYIRANLTDVYPFEFIQKKDEKQQFPFCVGDSVIVKRTLCNSSSSVNGTAAASSPYLSSSFSATDGCYLPCTYVMFLTVLFVLVPVA